MRGWKVVPMESIGSIGYDRLRWKSTFSVRERLRKNPLLLDEGVESRSDGVHWIHWTRIDADGKVHFLFVRDLENSTLVL